MKCEICESEATGFALEHYYCASCTTLALEVYKAVALAMKKAMTA